MKKRKPKPRARSRPPKKPAPKRSAAASGKARAAINTTCDIYVSPNVPPAAPDVAGEQCTLIARFPEGAEASEGDTTFRWTHLLHVDGAVDIRDTYPNAPANRVYVPDKNGTGFDIVFVELVNRGSAAAYKRVYLDRRAVTWPSNEL